MMNKAPEQKLTSAHHFVVFENLVLKNVFEQILQFSCSSLRMNVTHLFFPFLELDQKSHKL